MLPGRFPGNVGQGAEGPSEGCEHLLGVSHREEVHGRRVPPLDQRDLQLAHEPGRRHPEIVPDQDQALDPSPVALPQRLHQLALGRLPPRVQPLLELVQHDEDLLARGQNLAAAQARHRRRQAVGPGQVGALLRHRRHQPGLGPVRRGLDVDGPDVIGQPGHQAGLDQRRLAAARRPVDQPHGERLLGVGLLDAGLPEADARGQPIPVAGAGQEAQEEVRVGGVERRASRAG